MAQFSFGRRRSATPSGHRPDSAARSAAEQGGRGRITSQWRALLWRWRWVGLAILVALGINSVASAAREQAPETMPVVVAAKPISSGQLLEEEDLSIVTVPKGDPPQMESVLASDPQAFVGKHVVAPVPAGAPLYVEQLLDDEFLEQAPPGTIITSVPIADNGSLELISVGSTIGLYAPPEEFGESSQAELVVANVLVVGKSVISGNGTFLREVGDTEVFHVAIPASKANVVIGIGARTPFHAVLAEADE